MKVAFFAPMKPPGHPVPSGDRAMGRALIAALTTSGHAVAIASTLRIWCATPEPEAGAAIEAAAEREVERLTEAWAAEGPPDLWFTYHSYYRAPDLLGPPLAARFGLPYVVAEASQAGKRAGGPWGRWHESNERAIRAAAVHVCFTDRDAGGLATLVAPERIVMLAPFLVADPNPPARPEELSAATARLHSPLACREGSGGEGPSERVARRFARTSRRDPDPPSRPFSKEETGEARRIAGPPVRLVTAAMMRPGKRQSYAILAEALSALPDTCDWQLAIAGDGPERAAVEAAFVALPRGRVTWHGTLRADDLAALFASSELFVWPGFREPFGVVYLEAAAAGLPVLAMDSGGVASVVEHGRTGLLVPEDDVAAYAAALARLMADTALRACLGREGRRMVVEERTLARAGAILTAALDRASRGPA